MVAPRLTPELHILIRAVTAACCAGTLLSGFLIERYFGAWLYAIKTRVQPAHGRKA